MTRSSGSASLDVGTCDLITGRGRFLPGRDEAGKAVADSYVMTITWRLVQDELWKVEDYVSRVIYSIDPSLLVTGCRVEEEPADPNFDPRTCAEFRANAQMMVDASPTEFDWNGWNFIVESTQFAGAGDAAMMVGKRDGEMLFDRDITRMTIDPEGRITRCETVERPNNPWLDKSAWCDRMMRNTAYEPAPGKVDRLLTGVKAIYLRKRN